MVIKGKTVTNVDDPNGVGTTTCEYISKAGVVVGFYVNSSGDNVGFEEKGGTFQDVLPFGASNSIVGTISDSGVLAGVYTDATTGVESGFYGTMGNFTSFSVPTATATVAAAGNNAGIMIAVWEDSSGNVNSSLYDPSTGKFTEINVPGAILTSADFINNLNQIVYAWEDSSDLFHGAVRTAAGKFIQFDDPDGTNTQGDAINDAGLIVGAFTPTGASAQQSFAAKQQ